MSQNKYEAIIVLDPRGREDSVDKIVGQLSQAIEAEGARLEQIDNLGIKKFAYTPHNMAEGVYVSIQFAIEPAKLETIRAKFKLNPDVFLQQYHRRSA